MYKLINDEMLGIQMDVVKRITDNVFIPFDEANRDYQEYLEWLAEGNTPEAADS
jgi:hypothetical protein